MRKTNILLQTYKIIYTLAFRPSDLQKYYVKSYSLHFFPNPATFNLQWFYDYTGIYECDRIDDVYFREVPDIEWHEYLSIALMEKLSGIGNSLPYEVESVEEGLKVKIKVNETYLADIIFDTKENYNDTCIKNSEQNCTY
jgi:hypothetical protein